MGSRLPLHVQVIFVGRTRATAMAPALDDYGSRIGKMCRFEASALKNAPTLEAEGRSLARAIDGRPYVALDPAGAPMSSDGFLQLLQRSLTSPAQAARFVIGGAAGLPPAVREGAAVRLALTPLTLSHDLARLVLLEQIYRALATMTGSPYAR